MANAITSKTLANASNHERTPIKYYATITGIKNAHTYHYLMPSVKCKLLGAKLNIITAAGAVAQTGTAVTKETAVPSSTIPFDAITQTTAVGKGTAVDSDALMATTNALNAVSVLVFTPGANFNDAVATFDPANNDAIIFDFHHANNSTLMVAVLEVEFIPVI
ncbi:MAG TPA: hypothetical protein P5031_08260 [Candidatus Syntrophosphaera sp.]|nr:hypothetical protein [Candidatus Syntrophosphaera sp.]